MNKTYTTLFPALFRPGKRSRARIGALANRCQKRKNRRILAKASRKRNHCA